MPCRNPLDYALSLVSIFTHESLSNLSCEKQTASHPVSTDSDGFSLIRYENDAERGAQTDYFPYLELWQNLIRRSQACLGLNTDTVSMQ